MTSTTRLHRLAFAGLFVFTSISFAADGGPAPADFDAIARLNPPRPNIPAREFALTDFGAVADGQTLNTAAFEKAIAAVKLAGGGRLVVPKGTFVTGPFALCSQLELHLAEGAVIQAPQSFEAVGIPDPATLKSQDEVRAIRFPQPLIHGKKLHDVALTGPGVIDGAGALWWAWSERAARAQPGRLVYFRPHLVVIEDCERLLVSDLTLRNSPKFHLVPRRITNLTIERVKVRAPATAPNTDAIDPGPVTNAVVRDCDIDTGDDDIVIKSGGKNILIENCTIKHGHGISIGSETTAGVDGMLVRNCSFDGTDNGIRIKSMRGAGGLVRNVRYRNITMREVADAIVLDLTYVDNNRPDFRGDPSKLPSIEDILIENVTIHSAKRAGRIVGLPDSPIRRVTLRDVKITAGKDLVVKDAGSPAFENVQRQIGASAAGTRGEPVN